jgi:AhpC/TSA family
MKQELSFVVVAVASLVAGAGCSSNPLTPGPDGTGSEGSTPAAPGSGAVTTPSPSLSSDWVAYPAGPYGTARGEIIQNLEFLGWRHPDQAGYDITNFDKVRLSDFYNPDGHTDVKLLAVNASAVWCSVCRAEYEDMNTNATYATYRAKGVEILGTLFQDVSSYPAQPTDLRSWASQASHAVKFPFVLDPGFKMGAYFDSDATPLNMVIDVRTMTIVLVTMGYSTDYWTAVQALLDKM